MNRIVSFALAGWLAATVLQAAPPDPEQLQNEAYVQLVQADQHFDAGEWELALAQYRLARDNYLRLLQDVPDWEPRIIQFRRTYCETQIVDIEQRLNPPDPDVGAEILPEPFPPPIPSTPLPEIAEGSTPELDPLPGPQSPPTILEEAVNADGSGEQPSIDEESTLALQTELAKKDKKRHTSDQEQDRLRRQVEESSARLTSLENELAEKSKQIKAAEKETDRIRKRAEKADAEKLRLQAELEAREQQLQEQLAARADEIARLQAQIAEMEARAQAASPDADTLRQELEAATQQIATLEQDARSATVRSLRRELAEKDKQIKATEKETDRIRKRTEKADAEMLRLQAELEAREQQLQEQLAARADEIARLQAQIAEMEARTQAASPDADTLRLELEESQTLSASFQAELESKTAELEALEAAAQEHRNRLEQYQQSLLRLQDQLATKELETASLQTQLQDQQQLHASIQQANNEMAELHKNNVRLTAQLAESEASLQSALFRTELAETKERQADARRQEAEQEAQAAQKQLAAVAPAPAGTPRSSSASLRAAEQSRRLMRNGNNQAALAIAQEARRSAPADWNLALIEGTALIRLRHYPEAVSLLSDLARKHPRNAEIHAALGAAQIGTGAFADARETLQTAIRYNNQLPETHFNLAQIHARIEPRDLKQARQFYRQALELGLAPNEAFEQLLK